MAQPSPEDSDIQNVLGVDAALRRGWRRWRLPILGLVVVALLGVGYLLLFPGGNASGPRWVTAPVTRGDLTVTVTATGTIQPINMVEVSSELSGIVRKVNVDANDKVEVGQVLAELDTDKLKAQVAHARATLASRKAKLVEAEATVSGRARSVSGS